MVNESQQTVAAGAEAHQQNRLIVSRGWRRQTTGGVEMLHEVGDCAGMQLWMSLLMKIKNIQWAVQKMNY